MFQPGSDEPQTLSHSALSAHLARLSPGSDGQPAHAWLFAPEPQAARDDTGQASLDSAPNAEGQYSATGSTSSTSSTSNSSTTGVSQTFNFRWFVPELLRHKTVWRDVLLASLALQIVTLAIPPVHPGHH